MVEVRTFLIMVKVRRTFLTKGDVRRKLTKEICLRSGLGK